MNSFELIYDIVFYQLKIEILHVFIMGDYLRLTL